MINKILGFVFAGITIITTLMPWAEWQELGAGMYTHSPTWSRGYVTQGGGQYLIGAFVLVLTLSAIGLHFVKKFKRFAPFFMAGAPLLSTIFLLMDNEPEISGSLWGYREFSIQFPVYIAIVASLLGTFFMFRAVSEE
tara:strand:+ start:56 stop:469 length:414 start_codon:yes stop_codon:yes gene_type:complete